MNILETIIQTKWTEISDQRREVPVEMLQELAANSPAPRRFAQALRDAWKTHPAIIAEIKFGSPSLGKIREKRDVERIALSYVENGAAALSILTDTKYFMGSPAYLPLAKERLRAELGAETPLLRKDFIVDPYQLWQSRVMGADAVLLIVAALSQDALVSLLDLALELQLDVLVEVHTEAELQRAVAAISSCYADESYANSGASPASASTPEVLLGINCRNLKTFERDLNIIKTLLGSARALFANEPRLPNNLGLIAESGINTADDIADLRASSADGFLVGTAFMTDPNPGEKLRAMLEDYAAKNLKGI